MSIGHTFQKTTRPASASSTPSPAQRGLLQRKHAPSGTPEVASRSLDPATRAFMEPPFGHDFGQIRVHADKGAPFAAGPGRMEQESTSSFNSIIDFPHRSTIEMLTGNTIPGGAIVDSDWCRAMGTEAFADRQTACFRSSNPSLKVAAHEAAHLMQHAGLTTDAGLGAEAHAGSVAHEITRGRPAGNLLGSEGTRVAPAVRPYTTLTTAQQAALKQWEVGDDARVSDDGRAVVLENTLHDCYADSKLIADSEAILSARGSGVSIKAGGKTISGYAADGSGKKTLNQVAVKISVSDVGTENFYADCGRSSRQVMSGTDNPTKGVYKDYAGVEKETVASKNPAAFRDEIFANVPRPYTVVKGDTLSKIAGVFLGDPMKYMDIYNYADNKATIGPDPGKLDVGKVLRIPPGTAAAGKAHYLSLTPAERDAFDKLHGLNKYADPSVGEAFTARRDDDLTLKGFNFHWAGVIMEAGHDTVTFENFARPGTTYDTKNEKWFFQIYGPPTKAGQTFHEQNESSVGEAGKNTMTFRARP